MKDFYYLFSFKKENQEFQLKINLQYENYLVPVFNHCFNNEEINPIYNQIFEYFNHTNIKATKNDLILFYNAFKDHDCVLPEPLSIDLLAKEIYFSKGLTPKEILFLMYIDTKSVDGKVAKYWVDQYHIDIDYTIEKLMKLDFITTNDYLFNVEKQTKKNLLALLKEKDIKVQGNKPQVVQAVKDHFGDEELASLFSGLNYKQTIKGEEITLDNENLNDFHKSYYRYANDLKIEEFYILTKRFKDLEAKEVIKMMVEKKNNEEITDFDWDKFFEEEVKDNKKIEDFAEVIKKYAKTEEKVETSKVSDDDFFDVVYKKKTEENVKENVEVDISDDEFYKILNKIKAENSDIEEKEQEVIKPLKPKYKENKEDYDVLPKVKLRQHFIRYFLYSSVLSLIIIYSLYYYVFK